MKLPPKLATDVRRLRAWLLLLFVALAIPTGVLVDHAFRQLKWEALHQHRRLAEELTARIDARLAALIAAEERRGFGDYAFLVVTGDPAAKFLQRSPLSALPDDDAFPGLVGHFQIDPDGRFSSPLLPGDGVAPGTLGLGEDELTNRSSRVTRIRQLLAAGRAVHAEPLGKDDKADGAARKVQAKAAGKASGSGDDDDASATRRDQAGAGTVASMAGSAQRDAPTASSAEAETAAGAVAPLRGGKRREAPTASSAEPDSAGPGAGQRRAASPVAKAVEAPAQALFDRLNEADELHAAAPRRKQAVENLGRVESLKLDPRYRSSLDAELKQELQSAPAAPLPLPLEQRALRKESSASPAPGTAAPPGAADAVSPRERQQRIRAFDSEVNPFEFALLDSDHFVLFRNAWRGGQRFIQGALIAREPFLDRLVRSTYAGTALSRASDLLVAYRGDVLSVYRAASQAPYLGSAEALTGALLHQARLSAPLSELELITSVSRLPTAAGATLLAWVSGVLVLVLFGGFWLLYRLGLGQIRLAAQQQDFVSAVSHELKTPLTSIRMYGEMLREGWVDERQAKQYYDYIHGESERLSRLIDNVLQLARLTRSELKLEPRELNVAELVDGLRSKVASQVERAGFLLAVDCDAGDAGIRVDPDAFVQVVINLIDNAIKFSAKAAEKRIDFGCRREHGGMLLFTLRDYGPGVPRDQMKKIFRLFYRSENELTRETVGTGIGLALVHQLVQAMDGRIDVVNREPGAEFRLLFPTAGPSQGRISPARRGGTHSRGPG